MESKNKAEEAKKDAIEILKAKYPHKSRFISRCFEMHGRLPREFKEEYEKIIFPQELKKLEEEGNVQKIEELTDTLKRLQAEFENYKKRIDKEKIEFVRFAQSDLIQKLLPVLDTFEIALKSTKDNEKFVNGMEMIYAQFYSILESSGLKHIKALGERFDPYKHEVLMKEECDKEDDIVLDELQKGYLLNDKVLRHSKVKVSCKKSS